MYCYQSFSGLPLLDTDLLEATFINITLKFDPGYTTPILEAADWSYRKTPYLEKNTVIYWVEAFTVFCVKSESCGHKENLTPWISALRKTFHEGQEST